MDESKIVHAVTDLLGNSARLFHGAVFKDDCEFVTPQASKGVERADRVPQQLADLLQQLVPDGVTTRIVDQLELVQIDIQQRMVAVVLLRMAQSSEQS